MGAAQDLPYGFSPNSSAEFDDQFDTLKFEDDEYALGDDDLDEQGMFDEPSSASASGAPLAKKKRCNNRKGPQNADKRATHNAVERKRRESLNTRFIDLAKALPTTKHIKRPSKAVVITKALDYVYDASAREHALTKENNELRCEVDQLRLRLGMPPLPPPAGLPEHRAATQATLRKNRKASTAPPESDDGAALAAPVLAPIVAPVAVPEVLAPAPALAPAPTTPAVESPASYLAALPSPTSSASSSSAVSAIFDVTSPELAAAASYSSLFSTSSESPAEVPLALASSPLCQAAPRPAYYPGGSTYAHQQAAAAYASALNFAGLFPQPAPSQPPFIGGGGAYLSPEILMALQTQQAQMSPYLPAPEWLAGLASPSAGPTSMFATSY